MMRKAVPGILVRKLAALSCSARDLVTCSSTDTRCNTGEIEVDYSGSVWDDWKVHIYGSIDTDENREEYPNGFAWDCCGVRLDSDNLGCLKGPHREVVKRRKIKK